MLFLQDNSWPPSRGVSYSNKSSIEFVNGDLAFYITVAFLLFALFVFFRVRKSLKDDEKRDKLLELKIKQLFKKKPKK